VLSACTPRGHYFVPIRQFGQRFAFVLPQEDSEESFRWDPDEVIRDALAISRLVRDHGFSLEYAARIFDYRDGEQSVMYVPSHAGKLGYRLRRDRDWLDPEEAVTLRGLLATYWSERVSYPVRVRRAMWRFEYAYSIRWADVILPVLISGLEALTKVGRRALTHQFATRSTALASELGLDGVDYAFAERMYDGRSAWIHGGHYELFRASPDDRTWSAPIPGALSDAMAEVARVQDLLRLVLRRCLEDTGFRDLFGDDETIAERWPVPRRR
jgi:hypothetical protein